MELYQDGSDGITVLFEPDLLDQVADILLLKRRRRVSEAERARPATIGRGTQYQAHGTGAHCESRPCVPGALVDG